MSSSNITTCYDFNGTSWINSTICPNTNVCCPGDTSCTAKGVCNSTADGTLERPTCTTFPWTDDCSPICHYEKSPTLLPSVEVCEDGSYCCDDNPQCCAKQLGINLNANGQVISTETGPTAPTSTSMASNSDALATSPPLATPTASPNTLSASTINPPYIVPNTSYTPASLAGLILIILTLVGLTISQIILYVKVRRNKKATQTKLEVLLRRVGDEYYFGARAAGGPKGGRGTGVVQMKDSRTLREMRGSGRPAELESPEIG